MLLELKIKNLVLIEEAHLDLDNGFVVFTGETGAGKSLLVKAIKLLLGEKGGSNYIRPGAENGEIEALIWGGKELSKKLENIGYTPQEEIHVRRIISPKRQKTYVNGSPITLSELSYLTKDLIILTSQHEFYTLLHPEKQLEFLDQFLGLEPLLEKFKNLYNDYKNLLSQIKILEDKIAEAQLKKDFILFQINELEELNPDPEEENKLLKEREKLKNLSFLKENLHILISAFEENDNNLSQIISIFEKLSNFESGFKDYFSKIYSFYYEMKEIHRDLSSYLNQLPEDDTYLNEIEERLARYEKLKRKYKRDTHGLIELLKELKDEINLLDSGEEKYEKLKKKEEELKKELFDLAFQLSKKRVKGAPELQSLLKKELKDLGIEKAEFKIKVISKEPAIENLTSSGLEEVKFLFSPNPGIPLKPLEKIASGGELSRIFLACKSIMQDKTRAGTLIFDEVDTGIGGITAKKVAQKIKNLSKNYQILCITHLPQIAALADSHYVVEKKIEENKTQTKIEKVEGEDRLKEIARMLGDPDNLKLAKNFLQTTL
ncbi:DNA repair protein RecN [Thermodesulfobacterium hydrogeniphilum]|uniref:DNA repair protein RecN n=1 Tax=Thermodesulfobacterium hydrogeniphilum TaxID=161156 RepID=UPI00056EB106|nr:DNA repair protein RecN [Thermodesulfobacterium hydrogeniphilum]